MAEIRENEITETLFSETLPPEFLSGRKLDYAVNIIKDNPLDKTNQDIIKRFKKDYPELNNVSLLVQLKNYKIYLKRKRRKK